MSGKPFTDEQKRRLEKLYGVDPFAWAVLDAVRAGDLDPDRDLPFVEAGWMEFFKMADQMGMLDELLAKYEEER